MGPKQMAIDALLAAAVVCQLGCCLGLLVARDVFDRLHYAGAGSTVGPVLLTAAIFVRNGFTAPALETLAAAGLLFFVNPALVSATARAARRVHYGQVEPTEAEKARRVA